MESCPATLTFHPMIKNVDISTVYWSTFYLPFLAVLMMTGSLVSCSFLPFSPCIAGCYVIWFVLSWLTVAQDNKKKYRDKKENKQTRKTVKREVQKGSFELEGRREDNWQRDSWSYQFFHTDQRTRYFFSSICLLTT